MASSNHTSISGIYIIVNTKNNKVYIGQAQDIQARWDKHKRELRDNRHHNKHLQAAWNKYGEKAFKFQKLEYCSIEQLNEREQHYLDLYAEKDMCYNIAKDATAPMRGLKFTEDHCRKISEARKGSVISEQQRKQISATLTGRPGIKGRKHTEEEIIIMSNIQKNRSEEWQHKINEAKRLTPAVYTEESRRKMSEAHKGKPHSEEHKRKLSEAAKQRWAKQKAKQS